MIAKRVPSLIFKNPGTTAYCGASPSPVSPMSMKEYDAGSSRTIVKSGVAPDSSWRATQRRRSSSVGSPNHRASTSLRERHRTAGFSQDRFCTRSGIRSV